MSVLRPLSRHYLPNCPHESAHRALAHAVDDCKFRDRIVGVAGVGCGGLVYSYLDLPFVASPAGRGVSVARGLCLARPGLIPVVYVGDGELLGEGISDLIRAAASDAAVLVLLVDNQMQARSARVHSASTDLGTRLPSCPEGREAVRHSRPIDPEALLGSAGILHWKVASREAEKLEAILGEALTAVAEARRFALVHVLGTCGEGSKGEGI